MSDRIVNETRGNPLTLVRPIVHRSAERRAQQRPHGIVEQTFGHQATGDERQPARRGHSAELVYEIASA
jgi:hypothetical protein